MNNITRRGRWYAMYLAALSMSCIIPDKDIVVVMADPCGQEWGVQTVGAYGYNGIGKTEDIKDDNQEWLTIRFCLNDAQSAQMADPMSELAGQALSDLVLICEARAYEMGIADLDGTCVMTADIVYFGTCSSPPAGCDEETGADEGSDTVSEPLRAPR
jgi:hypothetical protein